MTNTINTAALIGALNDPDRSVRQRAAVALGSVRSQESADALVSRLGTETDCFVKESLTWAAVQTGPLAVPGVLAQLTSAEPAVRSQAAHVLSKIGDPAHAEHLVPVIADDDPLVAVKAFRAAANTGEPVVIPALAARLGDGDLEQRDALTSAFATLGAPAVDVLIAALADDDASVRAHAADTLGHLGSPLADPALVGLVGLLADADAEVRLAAVSALGQLGVVVAGEALAAAAASPDARVAGVAAALNGRRTAS